MDNQPNPSPVTEELAPPDNQSAPQVPAESLGSQPSNTTGALPTLDQPKPLHPHRKLWTIVGAIIVLIIIGALICIAIRHDGATTKSTAPVKSASVGTTSNASVNDLTSTMTQGASGESAITSTDDSSAPASMNQSASNVGASVNENNF